MLKFLSKFSSGTLLMLLLANTAFAAQTYSIQATLSEENQSETVHSIVYEMDPGTSLEGEAKVTNYSDHTIVLDVNALDAQIDESGNFTLKNVENEQVNMGAWIELEADQVSLAPNTSELVEFTLTLPSYVTPGQYAGGLVISPSQETQSSLTSTGLSLTSQIGLRVYLSVTGEITSGLTWNSYEALERKDSIQTLSFELMNDGNTMLDVDASIQVDGILSETQTVDLELGTIAPGETIHPEVEVSLPFMDLLNVKSTVLYSVSSAFASGEDTMTSEAQEKELKLLVMPWLYIGILGLILLMILGLLIYRKKNGLDPKTMKPYKVKSGDTILDLAKKRNCDWKKLAKANHLKPPYELKSGMVLLLPSKTNAKEK
jgi:LysM repeat protein